MKTLNSHCRAPGCTEKHLYHFCRNCKTQNSDHLSSECPKSLNTAKTIIPHSNSRCRAIGCNENHSYHYCRQCFNNDSDHLASKCPMSTFSFARSSSAYGRNNKHCRVTGCTEAHSAHVCMSCWDRDSDHFMSKCPLNAAPKSGGTRNRAGSFDNGKVYHVSSNSNFKETQTEKNAVFNRGRSQVRPETTPQAPSKPLTANRRTSSLSSFKTYDKEETPSPKEQKNFSESYAYEEKVQDKESEPFTSQIRHCRSSSETPVHRKLRRQESGNPDADFWWDPEEHVPTALGMPFHHSSGRRGKSIDLRSCLDSKWYYVKPILQQVASSLGGLVLSDLFSKIGVRNISCLQSLISEMSKQDQNHFLTKVIPFIAETALQVSNLFTHPLPLLVQLCPGEVVLSQKQCCCLLSLAFFDALAQPSGTDIRKLSFTYLLAHQKEKMRCIVLYFCTMHQRTEKSQTHWEQRKVKFIRKVAELQPEHLSHSNELLTRFTVHERGYIEDAKGCLQADFANQFIGGGVLSKGSIQEEIRFIICPECIVSIFLCERMLPSEAIVIVGAERFCQYSGYAARFCFNGPFNDNNDVVNGVLDSQLVAFDASEVKAFSALQYTEKILFRDFKKLYAALCADALVDGHETRMERLKSFATGNWGCGAFGGDAQLKCLMQWIIASFTKREVIFYSCSDKKLDNLTEMSRELQNKKIPIGQLFSWILEFTK